MVAQGQRIEKTQAVLAPINSRTDRVEPPGAAILGWDSLKGSLIRLEVVKFLETSHAK